METNPDQTSKFLENGKPVYCLRAEVTVDNKVCYALYAVQKERDYRWTRAMCKRVQGSKVVLYYDCPQLKFEQVLKLSERAFKELGVIEK